MPHFIVYAGLDTAIEGIHFPYPKEDKKCLCSLTASILVGEKGRKLIKGEIQGQVGILVSATAKVMSSMLIMLFTSSLSILICCLSYMGHSDI